MPQWNKLKGRMAPLLDENIGTDTIFPERFWARLGEVDMGELLFSDLRNKSDGVFILEQPNYLQAEILIAGAGFGIGAHAELAVRALADFGIRCIIAPSFSGSFYAACIESGILPISPQPYIYSVLEFLALCGTEISISLESQSIETPEIASIPFEIASNDKHILSRGYEMV